jgi:hypothetical protein
MIFFKIKNKYDRTSIKYLMFTLLTRKKTYRILRYVSTPFLHLMPAKILIILAKIAIILARGAYFRGVLTNRKIR